MGPDRPRSLGDPSPGSQVRCGSDQWSVLWVRGGCLLLSPGPRGTGRTVPRKAALLVSAAPPAS